MNILLIQPPRKPQASSDFWEPLCLETIVSELHDHDISLYYANFLPNAPVEDLLSQSKFDIAAITGFGVDELQIHDVCRRIRKSSPDTKVVIGGWWASTSPHAFFNPLTDFVVCGEGELTFQELVQYLDKNQSLSEIDEVKGLYYQADDGYFHFTGKRPLVDLTALKPPRRELFEPFREKITSLVRDEFPGFRSPYLIQTARGCNHRCDFCSVWPFFNGKVRRKSPEQLEIELGHIPNDALLYFVDDNFLMSGHWVLSIVDLLKKKNFHGHFGCFARADDIAENPKLIEALSGVGLKSVFVGFETFEGGGERPYSKKMPPGQHEDAINLLHQNGVLVIGSFIIDPMWGKEDFQRFADYLLKSKIDHKHLNILTPLPGTRLYERVRRSIITSETIEFGRVKSILPTKLSLEAFIKEVELLQYICTRDQPKDDPYAKAVMAS